MAEPGLKKQLYDAQVDGDTHEEEEARHLQVDKEAEIENNDPCIPGIGHEDAAYSIAAPGDCDGVSSQHGAVAEEPVENLQQKHLRADAVMPEAEGCNPSEVPVEIVVDSDEDGRREQGREGEETVNSLPDGEQFTQLQGQLDTYDGTECIGAEEEEEEYDEDPFLGEDPSVDEVEEDAVVTEQSSVAQVAPHAVPHPEEGDNRNTTPEADGVEEEAQEEEHEDTNASHQNRNKVSSERGSSPAEIKANLSEHRNLALNGPSERRRSGPQAPIVWDPSVIRPKSLFDHHQRLLDVPAPTHSEKQDFGGDVQRYTDKNLKITIASESTIGSHRLPQGKSKRRTHFGAGGFELEGCTALPGQESRNSLQLYRSSRRQQRGPKWNRRVTFTAKLNQGEKVEYVHHGDCISVRLVNLPLNFWYSAVLAQRFVVDPAEFDADYEAGVAKVELGMRARPEQWARRWINSNISRLARAKALRSFMKDRSGDLKPATFFYHFMNLCKGIQKLNPPISRDESEKAYERGCARTVGCATGETFEMLAALPRDTMCAYGILPHGCRSLRCLFSTGIVVVNVAFF